MGQQFFLSRFTWVGRGIEGHLQIHEMSNVRQALIKYPTNNKEKNMNWFQNSKTKLSVILTLAVMLTMIISTGASAAVGIVVNNNADDTVANDGHCTLREAIHNANSDSDCAAGAGADSITFAADYTITLVGSQLPAVTSEMTITGNGAANTIIQANVAPDTATYRVLQVASPGNLMLDGVTVRHGRCAGSCATYGGVGGGILNYGGTLSVTNSTLSGNTTKFGGGGGIANASYYQGTSHRAMLTVTGSILSGNSANGGSGGGISNSGTLSVTDSTLSGNSTDSNGGGIYNHAGTVSLTDSTLSGNTANTWGGGIATNGGTLTVTNSTLSGNSLTPKSLNGGGGIANIGGRLTVTNSTLSGNSATPSSGGGGGGIYNAGGGTTIITNNTLSGNNSTIPSNSGGGDEVHNRSSIIANASNVFGHSGQSNADAFYGFTPGASDVNATSDGTSTALASILDTTLADNGGPTQTHALIAGSPAIDFAGACGLATDQRGVARPQGVACDAGAFELVTNQPPTAVAGGPYLVAMNSSVAFDGSASSDPDLDMLTETWTAAGGTVDGATYTAGAVPGIYDVCLTVYDGTVDSDPNCTIVVVYDPSGGFVTGGGWIDSPVNADYQYMQVDGKATFGFVAKYKKGANELDGNTEFQFNAGDLSFHSTSYEWLVVAGNMAQFKGVGTINDEGSYKFMITADDDNPDTFRIKIWYEENDAEVVVYDNDSQQSMGGGSIKVH
jgi:CSLREA domain-containing protein